MAIHPRLRGKISMTLETAQSDEFLHNGHCSFAI
jgi:hypothetical protein